MNKCIKAHLTGGEVSENMKRVKRPCMARAPKLGQAYVLLRAVFSQVLPTIGAERVLFARLALSRSCLVQVSGKVIDRHLDL